MPLIIVAGGRLYLHVATPGTAVNRIAAALYAAEAAIVEAVGGRDGAVDPADLPAVELTPAGAPLLARHEGRPA